MRCVLAAIGLVLSSVASFADTTVLLEHKAWRVEHHYDPADASQICTAGSATGPISLDLIATDQGALALGLYNPEWRMPTGETRALILDADFERWTATATIADTALLLAEVGDAETAAELLADLGASTALAVSNTDMRRIATFSLAGSHAAVLKLVECWSRIYRPLDRTDPFLGADAGDADPFL
jgi:hypothetical protein